MLGIFLIICLAIYVFVELKAYYLLKEDSIEPVELGTEVQIYQRCSDALKLNSISIIVMLIGYLGCVFPFLFIEGVKTSTYISGIVMFGIFPVLLLGYASYSCVRNSQGYIKISVEGIEYKRKKSFSVKVNDILKITYPGTDFYQIHLKEKSKKPLNMNIRCFYKNKQIHFLMKQLRDHIARTSGQDKYFTHKIRSFHWMFERLGYIYIILVKTLLFLVLLYTSYCCIDYDFFRKDYMSLYNALNADSTQSENAWTYYVQVAQDYIELDDDLQKILDDETDPEKLRLTDNQKDLLKNWFENNALPWKNLKKAVSIKYCNATYADISLLGRSDYHDFSNPSDTGYSKIKYLYSNVNTARLIGILDIDWFELFEMRLSTSRHFANGKSFIDQLVGYAMLRRAVAVFADHGYYNLQDLQRVRMALKEYFPDGVPSLSTEGEILISCVTFDDMFNQIKIPIQTPLNPMFLVFGSNTGTEEYASKHYESILSDVEKGIELESDGFSISSFPVMRKMIFGRLDLSVMKIYRIYQRTETTLSATYVIIDLEKYNLTKGCYPADIQQLKEIDSTSGLPDDPDSGGSIVYSNDEQKIVLYAVGENGRDDGGHKDSRKSKGDRDDRIFWEREL